MAEAPFLSLEIREFLVAILPLFRPSLPWCFPIRAVFWTFEQKEQQEQEQQQQKEKVTKSVAEAPFLSLEIPIRELSFEQKEQEQEQQQQQQKEKVTKK